MGSQPWDRDKNDPAVFRVLEQAYKICEEIQKKLRPPSVSGGTTSNPERVITLYWEVPGVPKIVGVYLTFFINGSSEIEWNDGKERRILKGLSIDDLRAFDVPAKYELIKKLRIGSGNSPYAPSYSTHP